MKASISGIAVILLALSGAGCTTDDYARVEGVSAATGNAVAHNSVLQMVDPWPRGVENVHLRVPADRTGADGQEPAELPDTSANKTVE